MMFSWGGYQANAVLMGKDTKQMMFSWGEDAKQMFSWEGYQTNDVLMGEDTKQMMFSWEGCQTNVLMGARIANT